MANRDQCYACNCTFSEGCKAARKAAQTVGEKPVRKQAGPRMHGFDRKEVKRLVRVGIEREKANKFIGNFSD